MAQFMLLLYDDPSTFFAKLSPGEIQSAMDKYTAWRKKPFTVDAHRLGDDPGRVIRVEDGNARAMDGPYSETKEVLGGYYTINAANYDEAVKLALTHPHVELGGTIEVRHVFGT